MKQKGRNQIWRMWMETGSIIQEQEVWNPEKWKSPQAQNIAARFVHLWLQLLILAPLGLAGKVLLESRTIKIHSLAVCLWDEGTRDPHMGLSIWGTFWRGKLVLDTLPLGTLTLCAVRLDHKVGIFFSPISISNWNSRLSLGPILKSL